MDGQTVQLIIFVVPLKSKLTEQKEGDLQLGIVKLDQGKIGVKLDG